jgi:hypothetical protein
VQSVSQERITPPLCRGAFAGYSDRRRVARLAEIPYTLTNDPVVTWYCVAGCLEIAKQTCACTPDLVTLIRYRVSGEVRVPLTEPADYQAMSRCSEVKSRQHLPPLSLEIRLEVVRLADYLRRISGLIPGIVRRRHPGLSGKITRPGKSDGAGGGKNTPVANGKSRKSGV